MANTAKLTKQVKFLDVSINTIISKLWHPFPLLAYASYGMLNRNTLNDFGISLGLEDDHPMLG